jgi:hypothetical protein
MRRRETLRAALISSALALSLGGCGARTGLSAVDLDGGPDTAASESGPSTDASTPLCPPAPPPSTPLAVRTFVDEGPFLASSGCGFAAAWVGLEKNLRPTVEAATFRAPTGTWQSSHVTLAGGTANLLGASITWDGSAYVIGWVDGSLFLQRMTEDGVLLGPATQSFATGDVLVWLAPGAPGQLRVGLASASGFSSGNGVDAVSYARIRADGTTLLAATPIASRAVYSTFTRAADVNEVLSVAGPDEALSVESFDDDGVVQGRTQVASSGGPFSSLLGYDNTFAYLPGQSGNSLLLGQLGSAARVRLPGDYVPMLAVTARGAVGLLCSTGFPEGGLVVSIVNGTTVESRAGLPSKSFLASADSYAIAGGTESFGVVWHTERGLAFTVHTP